MMSVNGGNLRSEITRPGSALRRIFVWLAVLVIAGIFAVAGLTFAFHLSVRPVLTGSMRPTFSPGDAIVTRVVPTSQLKIGDIIVFQPPGETVDFAHRIVSITGPRADPIIRTRGDANPAVDPWHARIDAKEVPVAVAAIPYVGNLLKGLTEGWAQAIAIGLVGLSVWLFGLRRILYQPPPGPALVGAAMTE